MLYICSLDGLIISENTVKSHVRSILNKLDLRNRQQAAIYAERQGLSSLPKAEKDTPQLPWPTCTKIKPQIINPNRISIAKNSRLIILNDENHPNSWCYMSWNSFNLILWILGKGSRSMRNIIERINFRIRWLLMSEKSRYAYLWSRTLEHLGEGELAPERTNSPIK